MTLRAQWGGQSGCPPGWSQSVCEGNDPDRRTQINIKTELKAAAGNLSDLCLEKAEFLSQEQFCPSCHQTGDMETCAVVTAGEDAAGICWVETRDATQHPPRPQDSPSLQRILQPPNTNSAETEKQKCPGLIGDGGGLDWAPETMKAQGQTGEGCHSGGGHSQEGHSSSEDEAGCERGRGWDTAELGNLG